MAESQTSESLATAPPPPSEVKVRTMQSDIESMAKSGGGSPRFQNVKISGLSAKQETATETAQVKSKSNFFATVVVFVLVIAIVIVGWFVYEKVFAGMAPQSVQTSVTPINTPTTTPIQQAESNPVAIPTATLPIAPQVVPATQVQQTSTAFTAPFTHVSLFKTPPDQTLSMTLASGPAQTAADLETYNQKLLALLGTAKKTANFLEIDIKDGAGNDANVNELLTAQNAQVIDPQFISKNFNPDATFFAYRDKNGFWPGYVLALAPGVSQASVTSGIAQLESSASISDFFLTNIGAPSPAGFSNSRLASSSVRVLLFPSAAPAAYFIYGWTPDNKYLVLSTSENGFTEALQRLGE